MWRKGGGNELWLFISGSLEVPGKLKLQPAPEFPDPPPVCGAESRPEQSVDSQKQTNRYEDAKSADESCMGKQMTDFTPIRLHNS